MGIAAEAAGRVGGARTGASKVGRAGTSTSRASVALEPTEGGVRVFVLEEVKLLER